MYIVCLGLLVFGMWVLSRSFVVDMWQGPIFVAGILCISLAFAIPMRASRDADR